MAAKKHVGGQSSSRFEQYDVEVLLPMPSEKSLKAMSRPELEARIISAVTLVGRQLALIDETLSELLRRQARPISRRASK